MANTKIGDTDRLCKELAKSRGRCLLVMYYPSGYGAMSQADMVYTYSELREGGFSKEEKIDKLDVLLHTYGGDPVAAYRLAQLVRDFSDDVTFLVPEFAYSAGTLMCFAGDVIRLGNYAGLSPIDITITEDPSSGRDEIELANVECFMDFAQTAREKIEKCLKGLGSNNPSSVESDLLVKMVEQETALKVGKYFRERELTRHYAQELLDNYMFGKIHNKSDKRDHVIEGLLTGAPAHSFHIDYHLGIKIGLELAEMPTGESDKTKEIIRKFNELTRNGDICENLTDSLKMPFIRFYPFVEGQKGNSDDKSNGGEEKDEKKRIRNTKKTQKNV
jgi:hypothetical protein